MTFYIKQGDTSPAIKYQLKDFEGNPVNLTGFNDVEFHLRKEGVNAVKVNDDTDGNVSVVDASEGKVKYEWEDGDTDEAEDHLAEWEVEFSDGAKETFPNRRNIKVKIEDEIA